MFARDGLGIIIGTIIVFLVSVVVWYFFPHPVSLTTSIVLGILSVFNMYFFRDPDRNVPRNPLAVIAPADGKIVTIQKVHETEYFKKNTHQISIFLSVFNVHVNRMPISGHVDYLAYRTGKFLAAFKEAASSQNEQTAIGVKNEYGHQVLLKQIAGLIARRIICNLREGDWKNAGERMGLIRYGSRVDIFLPINAKVLVKTGQTVRCGETILATFPNEGDLQTEAKTIVELPKTEVS